MDLEKIREMHFVVSYRYFYNPFVLVVSVLIFFTHYVYTTLSSEGQDCILDQKEQERVM